jgi:hypothetical protein
VSHGVPGGQSTHHLKFAVGGHQARLDRGDLAEPAVFLGLLETANEVGADLFQPWYLSRVGAKQRAADAGLTEMILESVRAQFDACGSAG